MMLVEQSVSPFDDPADGLVADRWDRVEERDELGDVID
jgi:hypothetical protein